MTPRRNESCPCGSGKKYKKCCGLTECSTQPGPAIDANALLQQAMRHHQTGQLAAAEALYRQILAIRDDDPNALQLLGLIHFQNERHGLAAELMEKSVEKNPNVAEWRVNLGGAHVALNNWDTAARHYHAAIRLKPDFAEAHAGLGNALLAKRLPQEAVSHLYSAQQLNPGLAETELNLGIALHQLGRPAEAAAHYQRALQLRPNYAEAHFNAGNAWQEMGEMALADAAYRQALAFRPSYAKAHLNLGNALRRKGLIDQAIGLYRRAIESAPDSPDAYCNLAAALITKTGSTKEAVACAQRALDLEPAFAEGWNTLCAALQSGGDLAGAELAGRRALEINPDFAEAHNNLGLTLHGLGHLKDAIACFQMALEITPNYAEAYSNLGNTLQHLGQLDDAVKSYRRALEINPAYAEAYNNLGTALQNLGNIREAATSYRHALEIAPDFVDAHSNLLFCLAHSEEVDAQALFEEHCRFGEQFEAPLRTGWTPHTNSRNPERRLRVGFVSADLRNHPVAYFVEPVLAFLANSPQLSLHAYYNHSINDDITQRLRKHLPHWHAIAGLSDEALANKIREDGIDILIDLSGHTNGHRLLSFARKPAPIQATWVGYPNTTGLQAMDYVLMDRHNAPYGAFERYYVEKLARLPSSGTFMPIQDAPPVNQLPALTTGSITFGSFNRPSKLGKRVIGLWAEVLRALPDSRLLLGSVSDEGLKAELVERFARCGVTAKRLSFQPKVAMSAYLALHHQVDVILDTFPYTGSTTTNHALWMGVPVLTMTGPSSMQCWGAGVLTRVGLTDWVADTPEDFVHRAVNWAGRLNDLAELRAGMRSRLQSSFLQRPDTIAKGLEAAFRRMWQRWCQDRPSESFEVTLEELGGDWTGELARQKGDY